MARLLHPAALDAWCVRPTGGPNERPAHAPGDHASRSRWRGPTAAEDLAGGAGTAMNASFGRGPRTPVRPGRRPASARLLGSRRTRQTGVPDACTPSDAATASTGT